MWLQKDFGIHICNLSDTGFKQIKDQEARRRQKIEEEWRKNGGHKNEANSVQRESGAGAGAESSDTEIESGNSMSGISNSSSTGHHVVDGDLSTVDSKENQKTSVLEMESSEVSANFEDARGDQNLHEDPEKMQKALGCKRNPLAYDITAACSGFMLGLVSAACYIRGGCFNNVLVIGADALSRYVDWTDRGTCILFGDAAGAVVVQGL